MSDYVQRMRKERDELKIKADKLQVFIKSEKFEKLDKEYKALLNRQLGVMTEYLVVLGQRIVRAAG